MARPVEYDLEKVLDDAMEIFWQKGYHGVSMNELVSCTKLNRRTMYSLFKDKEGLFLNALEHYYSKKSAQKLKVLKNNPGIKGIEKFFETFVFSEKFKGCLFSNTIREKDFLSENTYSIPKIYFEKIRVQLEENLLQAKEMNDFNGDTNAMSHTIITFIHGFNVYGKYNHSKEQSKMMVKNFLSLLR